MGTCPTLFFLAHHDGLPYSSIACLERRRPAIVDRMKDNQRSRGVGSGVGLIVEPAPARQRPTENSL